MSEHVELPVGGWRLWSQFALRGPGFPAAGVLALAPAGLAEHADKFDAGIVPSGAEWAAFERDFDEAMVATAQELQRIAALPMFRAALAWQNRQLLDSGITPFLAWTPSAAGRTSMPRQREELVAHYWQRFCVKNDTIGFFGPVGWGRWDLSTSGIVVEPGTGLVDAARVYFSSWAIDHVARAIEADSAVRPWVPPRRLSFVRRVGHTVAMPGRPPQQILRFHGDVLDLCDGVRTAAEIAELLTVPVSAIEEALTELLRRRWIVRRLEVPTSAYPERWLRSAVERVTDDPVRARALAKLAVVERARDRVHAAGMDADALAGALADLETDFATVTEQAAARAKGARVAPCRSLLYGDARRSATATIGTAIRDELTPLGLFLTAARWMTNRFADRVGARIRAAYERLRDEHGSVDLGALWFACLPVPHPESAADVAAVQAELRARWAELVDAPAGTRRVQLRSADIAGRVYELFAEPGNGWNIARYVSPDLLVCAEDPEAVDRGEFELVLGELHVAMNTVGASLFVMQHPDVDSLLAETSRDFPGPRLMPMLPKEQPPRWSARSRPALVRPEDYVVALVDHTGDPSRPRNLLAADIRVEEHAGRLVLVLPDGAEFDVLDVFGNALTNRVMDRFTLRGDSPHAPRITIDRTVVARESWRVPAADVRFAHDKSEARRFVYARGWRAELGLPRFVFVVMPTEPRPFYVDFDSPVYVNILAKAIRRLGRKDPEARFTVTEMLPTPEQAWLTDDAGDRYTAELRFVAVDQTVAAPEGAAATDAVAATVGGSR
ncbi:lantibiotic dehydratase [Salinispora oceanensis]|uniref:lantibiotic dehydratase n=1 Tax=Salinispora oceanensis TaxID=1050199 RepID=UPI000360EDC6|nr:lantibiotic dehydratase [Salinispora oceanensis]